MTKDWRETLFVWDGILSYVEKEEKENENGNDGGGGKEDASAEKSEDLKFKWQGTWVGCDFADASKVPTPVRGAFDKFVSSENAFEVEGTATKGTADDTKEEKDCAKNVGGEISSLYRISMTGGSGYDLGEGSDKKTHKDDTHDMYLFSPTLRWTGNLRDQVQNMVLAVGENEFGAFISVGWLRIGNRVTVGRRYLDEGDERAKWDIEDLRKAVFDKIATVEEDGHVELVIPPWQCVAMNADVGQVFKRQKVAKE
mmetsp:Transcript_20053/g.43482  ORF Transcript_20053/g.43482 Transcript_20053/m.43482 type:complete len:255 (+) Transcript_20053:141-905(+)|eukprot:CAMPEP_0172298836 /NCGR_PEP_ID=MMETSP1058-20130122/1306_1 /TAXON_ID=83371 /ORGANISM="Detonula confervacea, Strain CCMP 353" /LENGTH=254 /DNA_ID=CAMNT_0013008129 /DNA_START=77 /DNA_END=841 /DNA_ORIENTATION=+